MRNTFLATLLAAHALLAAVPFRWTVETSRAVPAETVAYHGEEIALEATFKSDGKPFADSLQGACLYWQTNGMGAVWWTAPATVTSNRIAAVWSPTNDVGANVYNVFLGVPGSNYRAHLILRMQGSPGATPNTLPLPAVTYDAALNGEPTINGTNLTAWVAARSQEETDPKAPQIVSNIVTKAYVEDLGISGGGSSIDTNAVIDLIEEHAPAPGNYAAVSNAAMNALSAQSPDAYGTMTVNGANAYDGAVLVVKAAQSTGDGDMHGGRIVVEALDTMGSGSIDVLDSGYAAYDPSFRAEVTIGNVRVRESLENAAAQNDELWNYLMAENFRITVTNYDSVVHAPEVSFEYRLNTNESFRTVWSETNGLKRTFTSATNASITAAKAEIAKPENRAWGRYDSQTGQSAPDGIVQVSAAGGMMIGSDMGWTSIAGSGGQYWVLTSTDPVLCATGTNGVFEIKDSGGNNVMSVRKGDKRLVPAPASGISCNPSSIVITYAIESDEHPIIECTDDLRDGVWAETGDTGAAFGAAVWTGASGAWTATIPRSDDVSTGFFRASYWAGGGTVVEYGAAIKLTTIDIGGHQYTVGTATINGKTVLTLE